jgi:hydroxyacylglutathione hydrolase
MKISSVTVGPLAENCYLVVDDRTKRAALIDPGDEAPRILEMVRASGATLEGVWITHAHFDHLGALAAVIREHDVPIYMHPLDAPLHARAVDSALRYGVLIEEPPQPDHDLAEGDQMTVGTLSFGVMHLPGHAPGHVVYHGEGVIFGGDCLFKDSVGRTDLPYGDQDALDASLVRLTALGDQLRLYPGHGPLTTIGRERRSNPFLLGTARLVRVRR